MSRYHSYLNSAKEILSIYNGEEPFASFLKKYFAQYKKYGSKDRKQIGNLCYCYFRLGKSLNELSIGKRILIGLYFCSNGDHEILKALKSELNEISSLLNEKSFIEDIFPWKEELSEGIDHGKFCESFFQQPDLFLRLRPGKEKMVKEKLSKANIDFKILSDSCLALNNSLKIDSIIELDQEAVVQDYNSQQVGKFLKGIEPQISNLKLSVWDCCAGSGGKSIMLYDSNPGIELTVSDIRESILTNLKKRFKRSGINNYKSIVADLTHDSRLTTHDFDIIIADVPCTGSGTWSRTPEQLYLFDSKKIDEYSSLQKQIVLNIIAHLKVSGYLLYITCSVFKKENEEIVKFIKEKSELELIKMKLLEGYDKKADTMFVALFKKTL